MQNVFNKGSRLWLILVTRSVKVSQYYCESDRNAHFHIYFDPNGKQLIIHRNNYITISVVMYILYDYAEHNFQVI